MRDAARARTTNGRSQCGHCARYLTGDEYHVGLDERGGCIAVRLVLHVDGGGDVSWRALPPPAGREIVEPPGSEW